ncbi:cupredoxin domain-containing protein [Pseudonocardia sediminis]|nr:cupredoxin domain-containing protein [Pseudonocardia sediminis]
MLADSWTSPITTTSGTWRGLLMFCAGAMLVATAALQAVGRFVGFPSLVVVGLAMLVGLALLAIRQAFLIVTVLAVLVGSTLYLTPAVDQTRPGDLRVARERTGWGLFTDRAGRVMTPAVLTAEPGPVAIAVTNTDPLVGATFDIDELDVHVRIAPGSSVRVVVDAPPGRYRFSDDTFLAEGVLEVR